MAKIHNRPPLAVALFLSLSPQHEKQFAGPLSLSSLPVSLSLGHPPVLLAAQRVGPPPDAAVPQHLAASVTPPTQHSHLSSTYSLSNKVTTVPTSFTYIVFLLH